VAKTIIEQLRYLSTRDEVMKSFRGRYRIQDLPDLYFRMSVIMRLFLGMNIGKI
jgi:hypothetical protein